MGQVWLLASEPNLIYSRRWGAPKYQNDPEKKNTTAQSGRRCRKGTNIIVIFNNAMNNSIIRKFVSITRMSKEVQKGLIIPGSSVWKLETQSGRYL